MLHEALRSCANGRWGLLGQYPQRYRLKESEQLGTLGQKIDALRNELGIGKNFGSMRSLGTTAVSKARTPLENPSWPSNSLRNSKNELRGKRNKIHSTHIGADG
jgi:hypothetical protein